MKEWAWLVLAWVYPLLVHVGHITLGVTCKSVLALCWCSHHMEECDGHVFTYSWHMWGALLGELDFSILNIFACMNPFLMS
jgi:hypothetical protein